MHATEVPSRAGARVCAHNVYVRASVSAAVGALSRVRARAAAAAPPLRRAGNPAALPLPYAAAYKSLVFSRFPRVQRPLEKGPAPKRKP